MAPGEDSLGESPIGSRPSLLRSVCFDVICLFLAFFVSFATNHESEALTYTGTCISTLRRKLPIRQDPVPSSCLLQDKTLCS